MMSIKARGGVSIVQDPGSAYASEMPSSVLQRVGADHVVQPSQLAALLERLSKQPVDAAMDADHFIDTIEGTASGTPSNVVCPSCHGVITESKQGDFEYFRCHAGHTFTLASLLNEQDEELDRALWSAVRALEESSALSLRIGDSQGGDMQARFKERAASQRHQAELIREILLYGGRRKGKQADERSAATG